MVVDVDAVPFAARVRAETSLPVAAVGMITDAEQAERILSNGEADTVLLGREPPRDPDRARHAVREPGGDVRVPDQCHRSV